MKTTVIWRPRVHSSWSICRWKQRFPGKSCY